MLSGLRGAVTRYYAADGFFMAAGLAFFFVVTLIPILLLAVSTLGFVLSSEQAASEVVGQLTRNIPVYRGEVQAALLRIIETRRLSGVLGTLTLVVFATPLFTASRLVLHRLMGVRAGGNFIRNLVVDIGMVLLLGVLLFLTSLVSWIHQWFERFVLYPTGVPPQWIQLVALGLSLSVSTAMFYLGYRYVPRRRMRPGPALGGAVLASVMWEVAKQLFRFYIRRVGVYDQIYGPLGVLVAFVMFGYYSAVVFVFGAAYAATRDARHR